MRKFQSWTVAAVVFMTGTVAPIQNAGAWGRFNGGDHPVYNKRFVRQKPVEIHNNYVHGGPPVGCVGCGVGVAAVAGLVGGVILGAAIANSEGPPPTTVIEESGPPPGAEVSALPPGCASMNVNGGNYYQCGPVWYQPFFGGNGVYYTVVPAP